MGLNIILNSLKSINNIFKEGELEEKLVCKDFLHTTQHSAITICNITHHFAAKFT